MKVARTVALSALLVTCVTSWGQRGNQIWSMLAMDQPKGVRAAVPVGPKPATDLLHIGVAIPFGDPDGIQAFVDSVSDPKSPSYRHFITPAQIGARFGLSAANIKKVSDYLVSQGMKVKLVGKNRLSILADATVAQAEAAFHTTIQQFVAADAKPGTDSTRYSFTSPPSVPASISRLVTYVHGLEDFSRPTPAFTLTPNELRTLYSVAPIYAAGSQGQGRTIGITSFTTYGLQNIPLEYAKFGLPTPPGGVVGSNVTVESIDGSNGNVASGAAGEADADIQCVLAMAPLCNLIIYDDANRGGLFDVLTQESEDDSADIVTESYGHAGNTATYWASIHSLHVSLSAQGITYMCASGDSGTSWVEDFPYPDVDPEILTVGGTSVTVDGNGNRLTEVTWDNTTKGTASGGGWWDTGDAFNILPPYQKGTGVPTNIPFRLIPDLALDSDSRCGYEIFLDGVLESAVGGTSCASPTFAGALADCEQQIIAGGGLSANGSGKQRFGRIQDLLYSYNGDPTVFYDIISGTNGTLPNNNPSNAGPGWDTATGWGAMIFSGFVNRVLGVPELMKLAISPTSVPGGNSATGTVTLTVPAPTGGIVVTLTSSLSDVTVPGSVTVPAGLTSATFTIGTSPVTSSTSATITATQGGILLTSTLAITVPPLVSVTVSPTSVQGGNSATGTVTVSTPAPAGGTVVALQSSSANATVPASVTVAAGSLTATFSISTLVVTSNTSATITGTLDGGTQTATLAITTPTVTSVTLNPISVTGGKPSSGTVTLSAPAGNAGVVVTLSSNTGSATVPSSVTVAAGSITATFTCTTNAVSAVVPATITATQGTVSVTATLTINPSVLNGILLAPPTLVGGTPSTGSISLNGPAGPGGTVISLTTSNSNATTLPATVTVPSGASSATFTITTTSVQLSTSVTITAAQGSLATEVATLTITPAGLSSVSVYPISVIGKSPATGTVTLNGAAPTGGTYVGLTSNNAAATVPANVTVPAGATSATFPITTSTVNASVLVTITATQSATSRTASLTVNALALASVSFNPQTVTGGIPSTGAVALNGLAGTGGVVVKLSSNAGSTVTIPASVTIPAGQSSATFVATTKIVKATVLATVTAAWNSLSTTATLTVNPPVLLSLNLSPTGVAGGASSTGTVTLSGVAPAGGMVIKLGSNVAGAVPPASVTIAAGKTSATFTVKTTSVPTLTTATVTATLGAVEETATLTISPPTLTAMTLKPTTVVGPASSTGTVTLSGVAPTGGMAITLSSNSGAVSMPASVTVGAGKTSATFTVKTLVVGAQTVATISAVGGSVTKTASLTVNPPAITALSFSPSSVVGGKTSTGTVTIASAAPAGGIVVSLMSSTGVASGPSTVTILQGQTSVKFTVSTNAVTTSTVAKITATLGASSKTANLTVSK